MDYSVYTDYLQEAGLLESFNNECKGYSWKILNPEMFLLSSPAFIYEHCSAPLDAITNELLGPKIRIRPVVGINFDIIVYFKWLLASLQQRMRQEEKKEAQEIIKYKGKNTDLLKKQQENDKRVFEEQQKTIIDYLIQFGQKDADDLLPDEAISLYREFWKMSQWSSENRNRRPQYSELKSVRPALVNAKYHTRIYEAPLPSEEPKDKKAPGFRMGIKEVGERIAGGFQEGVNNIQGFMEARNGDSRKLEELFQKKMKPYEIQEIMEYIEYVDLLICNCAKKYF